MSNLISGVIPGSIGSTSVIAILIGLGFLMITGIASSRIIFSGIVGAAAMGALLNVLPIDNAYASLPFYYHLVMGGFLFGIVFMATDPVSAAASNRGKNHLWLFNWGAHRHYSCHEPSLSGRDYAGDSLHERDGTHD